MTDTLTTPSIYVACLASYNNAILHGRWIPLDQDIEDVWNEIRNILASSPEPDAEEYAIHDYEGFGSYPVSEYEGIEHVHNLAAFILEHEDIGLALLENNSGDVEEATRVLENYIGSFEALTDFVTEHLSNIGASIPDFLECYLNYEDIGRDMQINGEIEVIETAWNEVHVFYA
ncbi:MAG: antirestriction protein ArdA [Opitutales bacterium]